MLAPTNAYQSQVYFRQGIQKCNNIQGVPFKIRKLVPISGITGSATILKIF